MELYNQDCIECLKNIEERSIDFFVLDLPYANKKFGKCTAMGWDTPIDLKEMWEQIKRVMKPTATIVFFCNVKFGYALIHSNPKWFRYDLIWKKSRKVGFLSANKQPLRQHENIYVFMESPPVFIKNKEEQPTYNSQKTEGKPYKTSGKGKVGVYGHAERQSGENKGDRHPTSIIDHESMYVFKKEQGTYNPQKTEGKPYKGHNGNTKVYGSYESVNTDNTGDRHPTSIVDAGMIKGGYYRGENGKPFKRSAPNKDGIRHPTSIIENTILEHNNPHKTIHRTQKPVSLLEWLIKTYSNEGDIVCDFCMGSGTAGIACLNTKRYFIGCEKDKEIFEIASKRIEEHEIPSLNVNQ